jgi:hypothetical protein
VTPERIDTLQEIVDLIEAKREEVEGRREKPTAIMALAELADDVKELLATPVQARRGIR